MDSIQTGTSSFDSARLRYISEEAHDPLRFEFLKVGQTVEAFLSLERFRFGEKEITVAFQMEEESFETRLLVHEGGMRIRLDPESTQIMIEALQKGKEVVILVDGFEKRVKADRFSPSFSQFLGEGYLFQNLFKGQSQ